MTPAFRQALEAMPYAVACCYDMTRHTTVADLRDIAAAQLLAVRRRNPCFIDTAKERQAVERFTALGSVPM